MSLPIASQSADSAPPGGPRPHKEHKDVLLRLYPSEIALLQSYRDQRRTQGVQLSQLAALRELIHAGAGRLSGLVVAIPLAIHQASPPR